MKHTKELSKVLEGFELYILSQYDDFMEFERQEDQEYNSGISYYDTVEDFYSWIDMISWQEMKELIEDYKKESVELSKS